MESYRATVFKIQRLFDAIKQVLIDGFITTPSMFGQIQASNRDEAGRLLDELVELIQTPNTGSVQLDIRIIYRLGYPSEEGLSERVWDDYGLGMVAWIEPFRKAIIYGRVPTIECLSDATIDALY